MSGIETTRLNSFAGAPGDHPDRLSGWPDFDRWWRARKISFKPIIAEELLKAIGDVLKGEFALTKQVVPFLITGQPRAHHPGSRLTPREEEILACTSRHAGQGNRFRLGLKRPRCTVTCISYWKSSAFILEGDHRQVFEL
jgi:hypothetical protein